MKINELINQNISPENIHVKRSEVLRLLGYEDVEDDLHVNSVVDKLIVEAKTMIKPCGGYIVLKNIPQSAKGNVKIEETEFKVGNIIWSQLKKAEYIALVIGTIGDRVEKYSSDLLDTNEMLEGYVMNLIGSEAAEANVDAIYESIKKDVQIQGFSVSNRFSPGYCNWDVNEQFKLFSFFPEKFCEISLTESALMYPVKSVSAIVGIGKDVKYKGYKCNVCNDVNCVYRRLI